MRTDARLAPRGGAALTCLVLGGGACAAAAQDASTDTAQRIEVVAKRDQAESSFKVDKSETATRQGADLLDVPAAVTVVTGKVLETQQATSVDEALRNVSGVVLRLSPQGPTGVQVRGFVQTSALVNGTTSPYAAQFDVHAVERVEVLKGPQALLSGANTLGGAVNIVTKKPQAAAVRELLLRYGSFVDRAVAADAGGALGADQRLSYRVIGSWSRAGRNDAGFDGQEHRALMPQLRWKDAASDLIVGASIDKGHTPPSRYTFARQGIQPVPAMRLGNPDDGIDINTRRFFYSLEHRFESGATLVSRLQRSLDSVRLHLYGPQFPASGTSFGMVPSNNTSDIATLSGDHYVRFAFGTGPLWHRLSAGLNHTQQTMHRDSHAGNLQIVDVYAGTPYPFPPLTQDTLVGTDDGSSRQRGMFVQDLLEWGGLNLLLSARRSHYENGTGTSSFIGKTVRTVTTPGQQLARTTPGAGVVYKLRSQVALYASATGGFVPQFVGAKNCDGSSSFAPMETKNKELGAKFELLERRLAVTTSVFALDQRNVLEFMASAQCYRQRDAIQVRGHELDVQGELAPGWNLILNATHSRQKDAEKAAAAFAAQPRNALRLWTTYDLPLQGWGIGAGLSAHSRTLSAYDPQAVPIPGAAVADASVYYRAGRWSATLGVKNLADRKLLGYTTSPLYVPVEPGRTARLSLRATF